MMKTSHLKLQGLMCSGCSEIIERAMRKLAGVRLFRIWYAYVAIYTFQGHAAIIN